MIPTSEKIIEKAANQPGQLGEFLTFLLIVLGIGFLCLTALAALRMYFKNKDISSEKKEPESHPSHADILLEINKIKLFEEHRDTIFNELKDTVKRLEAAVSDLKTTIAVLAAREAK